MSLMRELYEKYSWCVVRLAVRTETGALATGTGFHIGAGYIVTARHVIGSGAIDSILGGWHSVSDYALCGNEGVRAIFYHKDPKVDLAVIASDIGSYWYENKPNIIVDGKPMELAEFIPLGGHLDDWLGDEFVMTKALLLGYPPVPFANSSVRVAAEAEVNAVIDKEVAPHPHFVLSAMPRGGFSGGPVISEFGYLLGVITESLYRRSGTVETGFLAAVSIEPLLVILAENSIVIPDNENILHWGS